MTRAGEPSGAKRGCDADSGGSLGPTVLRGHSQAVYGVDLSPDDQLLLSASATAPCGSGAPRWRLTWSHTGVPAMRWSNELRMRSQGC